MTIKSNPFESTPVKHRMVPFQGRFRRRIDLKRWDERTVVGWLEDDFHHFGMTLVHDGRTVTDIRAKAIRFPWTACPAADGHLKELIGQPLVDRISDIGRLLDMRVQCTHLFDLAGMVLAHARHGHGHRFFESTVTRVGPPEDDLRQAILTEGGAPVLTWDMRGGSDILGPQPFGGRSTDRGFREWTEGMEIEDADRAFILRRAVFVANGRIFTIGPALAKDMGVPAVCHTYQPEVSRTAERVLNHIIPFDESGEDMLSLRHTMP
jgi:hypothetical protein